MKSISAVLLFIVTGVYLALELAFNVRLIDVTSGIANDDEFQKMEFYGRLLSSCGLALLVFKGFQSRFPRISFLLALMIIPAFFFTQKAAVDAIVYAQSDEDKVNAALLMNLRAGMASGQIRLEDVGFQDQNSLSSHERSFIVALGPLTYSNTGLKDYLNNNYRSLIDEVATSEAIRQRATFYNETYIPLNNRMKELYDGYQEFSAKFAELESEVNPKLDQLWVQYMAAVKSAADNTRMLRRNVDGNMNSLIKLYQSSAIKIANANTRNNNTAESRFNQAKGWMNTAIIRQFARANVNLRVPTRHPDLFNFARDSACRRSPLQGGQQATLRIRAQKPNGSMADVTSAISERKNVVCNIDTRPSNLKKWAYEDFGIITEENYGVTSLTQDTIGEIIGTRSGWTVMEKVLFAARLPYWESETQSWRGDRATFNKLTRESIMKTSPLMTQMDIRLGVRVAPGLSFDEFVRSSSVQKRIRDEVGNNQFVSKLLGEKPVLMGQPVQAFKTNEMKQYIITLSNDYLNNIRESIQTGDLKSGDAIKAIWIPFIAMVLSLFMFSFNAIVLLVQIFTTPFSRSPTGVKSATAVVALVLVIAIPLTSSSQLEETQAYTFMMDKLKESQSIMASVVNWGLRAQPLIYPLGKPVSTVFDHLPQPSDKWL